MRNSILAKDAFHNLNDDSKVMICFELQLIMPTLHIMNSKVYYFVNFKHATWIFPTLKAELPISTSTCDIKSRLFIVAKRLPHLVFWSSCLSAGWKFFPLKSVILQFLARIVENRIKATWLWNSGCTS